MLLPIIANIKICVFLLITLPKQEERIELLVQVDQDSDVSILVKNNL